MNTPPSSNINGSSVSRTDRADHRRNRYRIGDISRLTGLSTDTLRYYEKINLLSRVQRTTSGMRIYREQDLSRLCFIQRAKSMNFPLDEIARLSDMRDDPQHAGNDVRDLAGQKLQEVEDRIQALRTFRKELIQLIKL